MGPADEALETFGVRVVAPLGGRRNRHWLVDARGERLVLRRWATPGDDIRYELRLLARLAALGWPVAPAVAGPVELGGRVWCLFPVLPGDPPVWCGNLIQRHAGQGQPPALLGPRILERHRPSPPAMITSAASGKVAGW